jgi:large subunit ribosomal protein L2
MAKRIIQQSRGKGSLTYRVRKRAFIYRIGYPQAQGEATVLKLFNSAAHTAPLAKMMLKKEIFFVPAVMGLVQGQNVSFGSEIIPGNVVQVQNIPIGTRISNIEAQPFDGGKFMRTAGSSAVITRKTNNGVIILFPSKKEKVFGNECRATVGIVAGSGRKEKPFVKAGAKFHLMKARGKLWPRTSAIKMNAIDHPFGSGRGKRPKSKIAKRNAPPGARVGHIRPARTGRSKR